MSDSQKSCHRNDVAFDLTDDEKESNHYVIRGHILIRPRAKAGGSHQSDLIRRDDTGAQWEASICCSED